MNTVLTETSSSGELQACASHNERTGIAESLYRTAARLDRFGFAMLRLGLVVVLCWNGGLKAAFLSSSDSRVSRAESRWRPEHRQSRVEPDERDLHFFLRVGPRYR